MTTTPNPKLLFIHNQKSIKMRLSIEIDYAWDLEKLTKQQKAYIAENPYHYDNMNRIITKTAVQLLEENDLGSSNAKRIHYTITEVGIDSVFIVEGVIQILQVGMEEDEAEIDDWDTDSITTPATLFYSTQPDIFWKVGRKYRTKCGLVGTLVSDWSFYDNHVSLKFVKDDAEFTVVMYAYDTKQPFSIYATSYSDCGTSDYDIVGIVE